jgi:hypothetical protein
MAGINLGDFIELGGDGENSKSTDGFKVLDAIQ